MFLTVPLRDDRLKLFTWALIPLMERSHPSSQTSLQDAASPLEESKEEIQGAPVQGEVRVNLYRAVSTAADRSDTVEGQTWSID